LSEANFRIEGSSYFLLDKQYGFFLWGLPVLLSIGLNAVAID
jgi:hypothetical protein